MGVLPVDMANPPFQVDGPPYPRNLPFYQTEALSWLLHDKEKHTLARFSGAKAIRTVKSLYDAGATRVDVVVTSVSRIEVRDHAAELDVIFPRERVTKILRIVKALHPDNWEVDLGKGESAASRYAGYECEVVEDPAPSQTLELWWD